MKITCIPLAFSHPRDQRLVAAEDQPGELPRAVERFVQLEGSSVARGGRTPEQIIEAGEPLQVGCVLYVLEQAAGALAEAHELGLIHRDIKSASIMLCNQGGQMGVAKVLDFGLVKEVKSQAPQLTQDHAVTGTPLYMSPEALTNAESVDARSGRALPHLEKHVLDCLAKKPEQRPASARAFLERSPAKTRGAVREPVAGPLCPLQDTHPQDQSVP